MKQAAKKGEIPYHSRCKRLCITHLCFAYDPLAFTNGTDKGVYGICEVLKKFYCLTGLQINPTIMEIFYSNSVLEETRLSIVARTGFKESFLVVRYLGVPLISGRLT